MTGFALGVIVGALGAIGILWFVAEDNKGERMLPQEERDRED